ncbi:YybH family protein [Streptomyces endophytica]|uniref:Nuclear transport factor 2 family protein n=1 Tax=Streptomyces endophytica TaxID=2991496 RepID=A0ABY6PCW8_9ACTN|nr:nuclear transport factor 2 family protein [Streptomyces endophytica]UZJ31693.1 nuclear transport factor 2 family protein [Streptomyces endophytica]
MAAPLPDRAEDFPAAFRDRYNSGDIEACRELYETDAVFMPAPGKPVRGEGIRQAMAEFLALGVPIANRQPRHIYTADDTTLLIYDWFIDGTGADGNHVRIEGTATDIVRRGPDRRTPSPATKGQVSDLRQPSPQVTDPADYLETKKSSELTPSSS